MGPSGQLLLLLRLALVKYRAGQATMRTTGDAHQAASFGTIAIHKRQGRFKVPSCVTIRHRRPFGRPQKSKFRFAADSVAGVGSAAIQQHGLHFLGELFE